MSMMDAIRSGFAKYSQFNGRSSRPEFWWWILFTTLVSAALSLVPISTMQMADGGVTTGATLGSIWNIAVLVPSLAVTVRRLRDADYAWGHVFWVLLPVAGLIVLAILCAQPSSRADQSRSDQQMPVSAPPDHHPAT